MNIVIANAWSDDNKGDAAIVEGVIRSLQAESSEKLTFRLVSMFRESRDLKGHYRHTERLDANIAVHPALLPVDQPRGMRSPRRVLEFARAVSLLLLGRHGWWLLSRGGRKTLAAVEEADLMISKGGHIYFSTGTAKSMLGLFRNLFPVLLAQRLGRPTVVYGQSIGPVKGRLQRWIVGRTLSRLAGLYVREPVSRARVVELGVPDNLKICWDTAFAVTGESLPDAVEARLPGQFVAMTVRQWQFPYLEQAATDRYEDYLAGMTQCIERLGKVLGFPVVVVPQAIGPTPMENDMAAAEMLRARLGDGAPGTIFLDCDLTAGQLVSLYGRAIFVLATRFHSAILAMTAGTPIVAVSYHGPKAPGIMEMMNLEAFVVDIADVSGDGLWSLCCDLVENRDDIVDILERRRIEIARDMTACSREILELGVSR